MDDRTRERDITRDDRADLATGIRRWVWNVRWDWDPEEPKNQPELEDMWDTFPDFLPGFAEKGYMVRDVTLKQNGDLHDFFIVEQEWERVDIENPLKRPFRWTGCESATIEVPAWEDRDGKLLQTTAGEPILGLTRKRRIWRLTGTRNVAGFPLWMKDYGESVNSDTIRLGSVSIPPNHAALRRLALGDLIDNVTVANKPILHRQLDLEIWWNPYGWQTELLNAGFYELVDEETTGSDGVTRTRRVPVRCQDNGQDSQRRHLLDRTGQRPRDQNGDIKAILDSGDVVVLTFNLEDKLPYRPILR